LVRTPLQVPLQTLSATLTGALEQDLWQRLVFLPLRAWQEGLRSFWLKVGKGRSPRSRLRGSGLEGFDKRTSFQEGMNDGPLDAHSLSVDDPYTSKPPLLTFEEVFFQERWNLFGRKRVQVDPVFDGNTNCFRLAHEIGHLSLNGSPYAIFTFSAAESPHGGS